VHHVVPAIEPRTSVREDVGLFELPTAFLIPTIDPYDPVRRACGTNTLVLPDLTSVLRYVEGKVEVGELCLGRDVLVTGVELVVVGDEINTPRHCVPPVHLRLAGITDKGGSSWCACGWDAASLTAICALATPGAVEYLPSDTVTL
jgi:hypothetical protein